MFNYSIFWTFHIYLKGQENLDQKVEYFHRHLSGSKKVLYAEYRRKRIRIPSHCFDDGQRIQLCVQANQTRRLFMQYQNEHIYDQQPEFCSITWIAALWDNKTYTPGS